MQEETSPTGKTRVSDERDLRLVIELSPNRGCPLREVGDEVADAEVHLHEGGCHCDFLVATDAAEGHVEHQSVRIDDPDRCDCACQVFSEYGCVPHLQETNADTTVIATYVTNRDVAWDLLDGLGDVCDRVHLRRVTNKEMGGMGPISELDLSVLSEKQRQALEYAISEGYYGTGASVSLRELAEDLGISASALSQRLKRAEGNLLSQLFD